MANNGLTGWADGTYSGRIVSGETGSATGNGGGSRPTVGQLWPR